MTSRSYKYFMAKNAMGEKRNGRKTQWVKNAIELSNLIINDGGEISLGYSNVKEHAMGVITYTLKYDPYAELPANFKNRHPEIYVAGWGNGYISIPEDHPFLKQIPPLKTTSVILGLERTYDHTYDSLNDLFPVPGNSWNWSPLGPVSGFEGNYRTFGFDTAHAFMTLENWPESRIVETIENFVTIVNANI